jgi:2-polyprenyl-3-methyl-5-hydroxy-6-metoxy-1,4-benzoquinol methylase
MNDRVRQLAEQHGNWFYDVPLPDGSWTAGNRDLPHTRLKRITQVVADTVGKPLAECRILDLACLEGQFALEMALQGAEAVGIEIRDANIQKALYLKEAFELDRLHFYQDDVRNISVEKYGHFDAIICSGILYHLTAPDALALIRSMRAMATRCVIIDTHISLFGNQAFEHDGHTYAGHNFQEHDANASASEKAKARWASADNMTSFWFSRPSLVNAMNVAGFSSVYECFTPAHLNYGRPGLESDSRVTFLGINGSQAQVATSPKANETNEMFPEGSLGYEPQKSLKRQIAEKIKSRLA